MSRPHDRERPKRGRRPRSATPTVPRRMASVDVRGRLGSLPWDDLGPAQGQPDGCIKISRGPALHQPGTKAAPTGALV